MMVLPQGMEDRKSDTICRVEHKTAEQSEPSLMLMPYQRQFSKLMLTAGLPRIGDAKTLQMGECPDEISLLVCAGIWR